MAYLRSNSIDFQLFAVFVISSIVFGYGGCDSYVIQPKIWEYKSRYDIGYEVAFATDNNRDYNNDNGTDITNEPILLLNGFGVGSFHQHRLIPHLLRQQNDDDSVAVDGGDVCNHHQTIYCIDYLGQGRSWPVDCKDGFGDSEKDLQYSADTWVEQIIDFIEQVILVEEEEKGHQNKIDDKEIKTTTSKRKVHLVGNSVGGHIAAHIARRRPDLISSICLLNPTPVWGSKLPGWNGHLPAPVIPKAVGRYLFDRIRDLKTVEQFLVATYSRKEALTQELMHQIRNCTLGNGGHAAFASIMWSPPLNSYDDGRKGNFQDCLSQVSCDVFLIYGQDDPWCKPAFAKNMLKALEGRRKDLSAVHRYIEISNAGHCPNHEAPQAVGHLVKSWVGAKDRSKEQLSLIGTTVSTTARQQQMHHKTFREEWGEHSIFEYDREEIKLGWVDRFVTSFM